MSSSIQIKKKLKIEKDEHKNFPDITLCNKARTILTFTSVFRTLFNIYDAAFL